MDLPDRQLACATVKSKAGEDYFAAMACGANFAWANRQMIMHWVRQSFEEVFKRSAEDLGMHQVYDVAHNIAKVEEYEVEGRRRKVYVHRKGATRAFPKDHPEVPRNTVPSDSRSSSPATWAPAATCWSERSRSWRRRSAPPATGPGG